MRSILKFFDKLEDHVRGALSHFPLFYSLFGGARESCENTSVGQGCRQQAQQAQQAQQGAARRAGTGAWQGSGMVLTEPRLARGGCP
jgi:hypothetical protein